MMRPLFAARALPALVGAAWEVARLAREVPVHELPERLRRAPAPLPAALCQPAELARLVDRCAPFLPPRRLGPCLRKALILFALWARCGLAPKLHLGARSRQEREKCPDFHAWVSAGALEYGRGEHKELWSG